MSDNVKTLIGKRVKSIRRARLLTQESLAEKADLNSKYLSSLECGKENPTLDVFSRLADALEIELSEIFLIEHEEESVKRLRHTINKLVKQAGVEKLKMTAKLVKAVLR